MRKKCDYKPGDILAFSGANHVSDVINLFTFGIPRWSTSHVGILANYNGELVLFESTTLDHLPCLIQGKSFKGSQAHRIQDVIDTYQGRIWHYPLTRPLYDFECERLSKFLIDTTGIPYDQIGAMRASDYLAWWEQWLHPENLSSVFCSEWDIAANPGR